MLGPSSNYNLLYLTESHLYLNSAGGPQCLRAWVYNVCVVYEVCVLFHEWGKLIKGEDVNGTRVLHFEPLKLIGLPVVLTSRCVCAVPQQPLSSQWSKAHSRWVCHLRPLLSITFLTSLLNYSLFPPFNFPYLCLLKLLVSITPSWIICSMSLISSLKPGNERLDTVIVSCLVPVWPAPGPSNSLFKGSTGRAEDMDERAEDDICLSHKLGIIIFYTFLLFSMLCSAFWQHVLPLTSSNTGTDYKSVFDWMCVV